MAWGKLGSTTASATTDEVSSGTITANDIINNVYHVIKTGTANTRRRFNNDTGSNYASRSHVLNNEGTQINQTSIFTHADTSGNGFGISYIVNISGEEKLMIGQEVSNGSNGAGTSPKTYEGVGKWTNTSAQITEVDLLNTDSGGFLTGSNLSVLGSELTPTATIPAIPALVKSLSGTGGWKELARTTLGSTADEITVSSLPDKRYYMYLLDCQSSGGVANQFRLGSGSVDTGSNYAIRRSTNGGTDATHVNATYCNFTWNDGSENSFSIGSISNLASKEKLFTAQCVRGSTAGAGTAPARSEGVGKWTNTSNPLDTVNTYNIDTGDFASGAELVVLGWDPADTHTTNFWEELASVELGGTASEISSGTITAKKYLWVQVFIIANASVNDKIRFNNDTASNYAVRYSSNGASDATATSQDNLNPSFNTSATNKFLNYFIINNSATEKLLTGHIVNDGGAGSANDPDRVEFVGKWANTSAQITEVDIYEDGGGSFDTGTIMKVWGSD